MNPVDFKKLFPAVCANINDQEIQCLLDHMKACQINADQVLIEGQSSTHSLYFVIDGSLQSFIEENGSVIELGNIEAGQYAGEISFLDNGPATASVKASTPCSLLELTQEAYMQLGREHPVLLGNMMRSISSVVIQRLCDTDILLFDGLTGQGSESTPASRGNMFRSFFQSMYRH